MEKYFTGQDFIEFDSNSDGSIVQRITKLEWINDTLFAHHGLEDSNSDTSDLSTQAWPFNPVLPQVSTGETDSDGNEIFTVGSRQLWDSSGEAFNYVEKKLGLSS